MSAAAFASSAITKGAPARQPRARSPARPAPCGRWSSLAPSSGELRVGGDRSWTYPLAGPNRSPSAPLLAVLLGGGAANRHPGRASRTKKGTGSGFVSARERGFLPPVPGAPPTSPSTVQIPHNPRVTEMHTFELTSSSRGASPTSPSTVPVGSASTLSAPFHK